MTQDKILKATHGSSKKPLVIGDLEIPCYVLEDGTRVLSQRGVNKALGVSEGGGSNTDSAQKLPRFIAPKALTPYISKDLLARIVKPIKHYVPDLTTKTPAHSIPAIVLPEICRAWIAARDAGRLTTKRQRETAAKAETLLAGLGTVGIIALVDEVTGYQKDRPSDALRLILEAYISKELLPWTKRFPDTFYEQIFRLNGWHYNPQSVKRPKIISKMTEEIIYRLLPPGVLETLREKTPKNAKGNRTRNLHESLSEEYGVPHLEKQIAAAIVLMRVASNWRKFKSLFNRAFPPNERQLELIPSKLPDEPEEK